MYIVRVRWHEMSYMCPKGYYKSLEDTFINLFNELSIACVWGTQNLLNIEYPLKETFETKNLG